MEIHMVAEALEKNRELVEVENSRVELGKTIGAMIEEMKAREIKTDEDYVFLDEWQRKAKQTEKIIDDAFDEERLKKKAPYDEVLERIRVMKSPMKLALPIVLEKMTVYVTAREAVRRAEVKRLEDESRKSKEDDKIVEAQNLASMGRADKVDEVMNRKVTVSRAVVAAAARAKLGKTQEKWEVAVVDLSMFLLEAAAMPALAECVEVSTSKLAAMFRRDGMKSFPGLTVAVKYVPVA